MHLFVIDILFGVLLLISIQYFNAVGLAIGRQPSLVS